MVMDRTESRLGPGACWVHLRPQRLYRRDTFRILLSLTEIWHIRGKEFWFLIQLFLAGLAIVTIVSFVPALQYQWKKIYYFSGWLSLIWAAIMIQYLAMSLVYSICSFWDKRIIETISPAKCILEPCASLSMDFLFGCLNIPPAI